MASTTTKHVLISDTFPPVALSVLLCAVLLFARIVFLPEGWDYAFLLWNLFLAWVPFALSAAAVKRFNLIGRIDVRMLGISVPCLLFLPNTFYLITDYIHLRISTSLGVWFDILMISSFVWAGMLCGYVSLRRLHLIVERIYGSRKGWMFACVTLFLSSIGIYLGRLPRFNSWDVLVSPLHLVNYTVTKLSDPFAHIPVFAFIAAFTVFLGVIYVTLFGPRKEQ